MPLAQPPLLLEEPPCPPQLKSISGNIPSWGPCRIVHRFQQTVQQNSIKSHIYVLNGKKKILKKQTGKADAKLPGSKQAVMTPSETKKLVTKGSGLSINSLISEVVSTSRKLCSCKVYNISAYSFNVCFFFRLFPMSSYFLFFPSSELSFSSILLLLAACRLLLPCHPDPRP